MSQTPVGEVRPSQLLWTYGPGSLIDLPNLSVVTMGTERWQEDRCYTDALQGGARGAHRSHPQEAAV